MEIKTKLQQAENKFFKLSNGLVYRKGQGKLLFHVPSSIEHNVIRANHEQAAHQGINKTCEYLGRVYWFPRMKQKVRQFIGNCLKCITCSTFSKMEGNLHCPDKGSLPFECVHLDHYGPLERTGHRQRYIFEVIDAFTKFVKFYPVTSTRSDKVIKHLTTYFNT